MDLPIEREQRKIRKSKKRFLVDGILSKGERRKLKSLQRQADTRIRRLKHNRAVSPRKGRARDKQAVVQRRMVAGQFAGRWV